MNFELTCFLPHTNVYEPEYVNNLTKFINAMVIVNVTTCIPPLQNSKLGPEEYQPLGVEKNGRQDYQSSSPGQRDEANSVDTGERHHVQRQLAVQVYRVRDDTGTLLQVEDDTR